MNTKRREEQIRENVLFPFVSFFYFLCFFFISRVTSWPIFWHVWGFFWNEVKDGDGCDDGDGGDAAAAADPILIRVARDQTLFISLSYHWLEQIWRHLCRETLRFSFWCPPFISTFHFFLNRAIDCQLPQVRETARAAQQRQVSRHQWGPGLHSNFPTINWRKTHLAEIFRLSWLLSV